MKDKRVIAINLPQFHPFKENDEWWGKGFTEWRNVASAKPRFIGHYQPHIPSDTGFYDLRLPEARDMQADMAKEYGIDGFCYYHYWFNGHLLMERPLNEILSSGKPDFPFMLCWANENWARNWDGGFKKILIEQKYSIDDDIEHIRYLCSNFFSDKRYIRVNGKPVFIVYRPLNIPNVEETIRLWRHTAKEEFGMDLYLIFSEIPDQNCKLLLGKGFDASMNFQPTCMNKFEKNKNILSSLCKKLSKGRIQLFNNIYSYRKYVEYRCKLPMPNFKQYPCVCPNFDNSPRRVGKPFWAFKGSTPQLYGVWLRYILEIFHGYGNDENFVFINAWNEWAEGNHLEPDIKWGNKYLVETKKAINEYNS